MATLTRQFNRPDEFAKVRMPPTTFGGFTEFDSTVTDTDAPLDVRTLQKFAENHNFLHQYQVRKSVISNNWFNHSLDVTAGYSTNQASATWMLIQPVCLQPDTQELVVNIEVSVSVSDGEAGNTVVQLYPHVWEADYPFPVPVTANNIAVGGSGVGSVNAGSVTIPVPSPRGNSTFAGGTFRLYWFGIMIGTGMKSTAAASTTAVADYVLGTGRFASAFASVGDYAYQTTGGVPRPEARLITQKLASDTTLFDRPVRSGVSTSTSYATRQGIIVDLHQCNVYEEKLNGTEFSYASPGDFM